jgi:ketosteroid isomerase-like protein
MMPATPVPRAAITVEDRLAIGDLYARQSHLIDGGDADGWAATFTADGVFESPTYRLTATGRAELAKFAADSNGAATARGVQLRHWIGQLVIDPTDTGAGVLAYLVIVATSAEGSRIDRSLRVVDVLARTAGGWRVASRKVFRDDQALADATTTSTAATAAISARTNP